jgi:hypothetical protein
MAKPPPSGPNKGDAGPDSSPMPDQGAEDAGKKNAMEETQKEAAKERGSEGGYQ